MINVEMLITIFRSKYTSWALSSLFLLTVILQWTINISLCWILLSIVLLSIYSFGYYFIDAYRVKFKNKMHVYKMAIFLVVAILFGQGLLNCKNVKTYNNYEETNSLPCGKNIATTN